MDLKRILSLLLTLEAAGKLEGRSLPALYDPNGDITLTVRADTVATREQFLADVAGTVDEAKAVFYDEPEPAAPARKTAAKKASKK